MREQNVIMKYINLIQSCNQTKVQLQDHVFQEDYQELFSLESSERNLFLKRFEQNWVKTNERTVDT